MVSCKIRDLRFPGGVYMETLVSFRSPRWFHVYFVNFGSGKPHFFSFTFTVPVYQWFVDYMKKTVSFRSPFIVPMQISDIRNGSMQNSWSPFSKVWGGRGWYTWIHGFIPFTEVVSCKFSEFFGSGNPHCFFFHIRSPRGLVFVDYMKKQFHSGRLLVVPWL